MRGNTLAAVSSWSNICHLLGSAAHNSVDAVDIILWTYNFGIHDCVAGKGYRYMWDETVAKCGSLIVASCPKHFFHAYRTGARSLLSYSDGCGGQNKNLILVGLYNELHSSGVYDILNHKFLTRGHTFLRNDTDFTQIKNRKASATVYVPSDWFSVVKEAKNKSPFEVVPMQQEEFMNFRIIFHANTLMVIFLQVCPLSIKRSYQCTIPKKCGCVVLILIRNLGKR